MTLQGGDPAIISELSFAALVTPIVVALLAILALRPDPFRSIYSDRPPRFHIDWLDLGLLVIADILFLAAPSDLRDLAYFALLVMGVVGGRLLVVRLRAVQHILVTNYLNKDDWADEHQRGSRWRYEMKFGFAHAPEYIDDLTRRLMLECSTYQEFVGRLRDGEVPRDFKALLDQQSWGLGLPTLRRLTTSVLPGQVFEGKGPYSSTKTSDEIYRELRSLAGDQTRFMDRLQYYWTLRNLNMLESVLNKTLLWRTQLAMIGMTSLGWLVGSALLGQDVQARLLLQSLSAACLVWLGFVGGGTSLLLVAVFNRTGTFTLKHPVVNRTYDAIWNHFVSLGIIAFFVTFLGYGVGFPLLLSPEVFAGHVSLQFAALSALSLAYCLVLFVSNMVGTHTLMKEARANALARLAERLNRESPGHVRNVTLESFKEARDMKTWPFDERIVAEIIFGTIAPVAAQVALIVAHVR